MIREIW